MTRRARVASERNFLAFGWTPSSAIASARGSERRGAADNVHDLNGGTLSDGPAYRCRVGDSRRPVRLRHVHRRGHAGDRLSPGLWQQAAKDTRSDTATHSSLPHRSHLLRTQVSGSRRRHQRHIPPRAVLPTRHRVRLLATWRAATSALGTASRRGDDPIRCSSRRMVSLARTRARQPHQRDTLLPASWALHAPRLTDHRMRAHNGPRTGRGSPNRQGPCGRHHRPDGCKGGTAWWSRLRTRASRHSPFSRCHTCTNRVSVLVGAPRSSNRCVPIWTAP